MRFEHETLGQRVRFAAGSAASAVAEEVARLGASRVMLIGKPLEGLPVAVTHREVVMHVPVEVASRARAVAASSSVDALVCVGGGSATGLAKAVALTTGLPIVAVPTTYAGSEATDVWGLTEASVKTTGVDRRVLPAAVVYDASLTLSLPVELSVASGLNALAHCVDSLWAPRADPINAAFASEGVRALSTGLPGVVSGPSDLAAREEMLFGAYLSAVAFASAGSGLHHKICHVLGGRYDLPHAPTHAVVLPYVLALNLPYAPAAGARLTAAFGRPDGLADLRARVNAPRALRDYGFKADDIPDAARAILPSVPESNPAPVTVETLERLLEQAWEGVL